MILKKLIFVVILVTAFLSGCSTTPGDAARRAGQTDAAAKLYEQGANEGDPIAAYKLAEIYHRSDSNKAIFWYKKAIELDKVKGKTTILASFDLADIFNHQKKYKEAKKWLVKSAEHGHHFAMYQLGGLYAENKIKPENDITGLMWIDIVTEMASTFKNPNDGHLYVLNDKDGYRKTLLSRMSKKDIKTAKQKAKTWLDSKWKNKS